LNEPPPHGPFHQQIAKVKCCAVAKDALAGATLAETVNERLRPSKHPVLYLPDLLRGVETHMVAGTCILLQMQSRLDLAVTGIAAKRLLVNGLSVIVRHAAVAFRAPLSVPSPTAA
jgi:hypothetical protein